MISVLTDWFADNLCPLKTKLILLKIWSRVFPKRWPLASESQVITRMAAKKPEEKLFEKKWTGFDKTEIIEKDDEQEEAELSLSELVAKENGKSQKICRKNR